MTALTWDQVGERQYETGVDQGVLYLLNSDGTYGGSTEPGVAWNGLTTVTESPSGAEATATYADNIKYLNLISAEQFGATVEAYTYPPLFGQCDGTYEPEPGVAVHQQTRKGFGLCYRTLVGNDTEGTDFGVKIHLVYNAIAAPSEKAFTSVNDTPEGIAFSWAVSTTPVAVTGHKPTSLIVIDSTKVDADALDTLLAILYGDTGVDPRLPGPDEVLSIFAGSITEVDLGIPANQPTYNAGTHIVTLPVVAHIQWKINGVNKATGAQPALTVGQIAAVTAVAAVGYEIIGDEDWTFDY